MYYNTLLTHWFEISLVTHCGPNKHFNDNLSSDIFSELQLVSYSPNKKDWAIPLKKKDNPNIQRVTLVWESTLPDQALEFMPVQPRNYGIKTRSATAAERTDGEQINYRTSTVRTLWGRVVTEHKSDHGNDIRTFPATLRKRKETRFASDTRSAIQWL